MTEIKISDKAREKLKPVDYRFLEAVEIIKKEASYRSTQPDTDVSFQSMINTGNSVMTNIRMLGRSATVQQLVDTALIFGLDFNWFIRKEAPFYYKPVQEGMKTGDNSFISSFFGENSKVNSDNSTTHHINIEKNDAQYIYQNKSNSGEGALLLKENEKLKEELQLCNTAFEKQDKEIRKLKKALEEKNKRSWTT